MRIDSSGNVGIGTSSPTAPLHVNSASGPQIKFGGSSTAYYWALDRENAVAGNLQFSNANGGAATVRMVLEASGNLQVSNLAGSGSRTVTAGATGILSASSDSSLKQEVIDAPIAGLAEILQIEPKAYKWLDDIERRGDEAAIELGFFADLVATIIPSAAPMGMDGKYGFYDRAMIAALVKSVHEINAKFEAYVAAHP
jgi:hypothetical protein